MIGAKTSMMLIVSNAASTATPEPLVNKRQSMAAMVRSGSKESMGFKPVRRVSKQMAGSSRMPMPSYVAKSEPACVSTSPRLCMNLMRIEWYACKVPTASARHSPISTTTSDVPPRREDGLADLSRLKEFAGESPIDVATNVAGDTCGSSESAGTTSDVALWIQSPAGACEAAWEPWADTVVLSLASWMPAATDIMWGISSANCTRPMPVISSLAVASKRGTPQDSKMLIACLDRMTHAKARLSPEKLSPSCPTVENSATVTPALHADMTRKPTESKKLATNKLSSLACM
mmetsp:Transcript_32020/g.83802  ORF Transcript_32020/g.83802 Transcript_32020/m.83802 type:complete len:290 (+) Transcript_32020:1201-2070(+)